MSSGSQFFCVRYAEMSTEMSTGSQTDRTAATQNVKNVTDNADNVTPKIENVSPKVENVAQNVENVTA